MIKYNLLNDEQTKAKILHITQILLDDQDHSVRYSFTHLFITRLLYYSPRDNSLIHHSISMVTTILAIRMQCLSSLVQMNTRETPSVNNNNNTTTPDTHNKSGLSSLVLSVSVPKLFERLNEWNTTTSPTTTTTTMSGQSLQLILQTLSSLATHPTAFKHILLKMFQLGHLSQGNYQMNDNNNNNVLPSIGILLTPLSILFSVLLTL